MAKAVNAKIIASFDILASVTIDLWSFYGVVCVGVKCEGKTQSKMLSKLKLCKQMN